MKKYSIEPSVIHLQQGSRVSLEVSTADVQHGFFVPQLDIKEPIQPGRPASIEFPTNRRGVFRVECGIICGPRHDDMEGKIIVE